MDFNSIDFSNKTALIRADLNVPIKDGKVVSDARIIASLPTIRHVLDQGGRVFVLSHLGRPTEGEYSDQYSLAAVAGYLATALGEAVNLVDFDDADSAFDDGVRVTLLENVRFNVGEKKTMSRLPSGMPIWVMYLLWMLLVPPTVPKPARMG